jgi:sugar O-acyltransferase (sialic acid O-acetyltransferase NeuD family)
LGEGLILLDIFKLSQVTSKFGGDVKLFIYCAGGFGKEIMDMARRINKFESRWEEICFIDDIFQSNEFYGAKLYPFATVLDRFDVSSIEISIANGEPVVRRVLFDKINNAGFKLTTLVDNTAIVSDTAKMGEGVIVTAYCSISSSAVLGNNVAINTKAIIGHDVTLGDHCVVSSLVNVGGVSSVGANSYIGMGVQLKEKIIIGKDVIVGMGSVVYNDIPDGVIALGNPARPMRKNIDKKVFKK